MEIEEAGHQYYTSDGKATAGHFKLDLILVFDPMIMAIANALVQYAVVRAGVDRSLKAGSAGIPPYVIRKSSPIGKNTYNGGLVGLNIRTEREAHPFDEDRPMPATSEARIAANRANSLKSCGPRSEAGKARSRANAVKHGLTGEGVALPAGDAAEVDRLSRSFEAELKPSGDLGRALVRRMALMSVRMDRCVAQETASLSQRVRQAEADFDAEWPEVEGEDDPDREALRVEASHRALFDPSKAATLARKYEAAAERCFFRSLKELRQVERAAKATASGPEVGASRESLGSFLPGEAKAAGTPRPATSPAPKAVAPAPNPPSKPVPSVPIIPNSPHWGAFELPFSIGKAR